MSQRKFPHESRSRSMYVVCFKALATPSGRIYSLQPAMSRNTGSKIPRDEIKTVTAIRLICFKNMSIHLLVLFDEGLTLHCLKKIRNGRSAGDWAEKWRVLGLNPSQDKTRKVLW